MTDMDSRNKPAQHPRKLLLGFLDKFVRFWKNEEALAVGAFWPVVPDWFPRIRHYYFRLKHAFTSDGNRATEAQHQEKGIVMRHKLRGFHTG